MAPFDILIVGCSIAGPTLASFLLLSPGPASQKPRITIVERAPQLRQEGQNIDIRGSGLTILKKLGLGQAVRDAHTGERGVQHVDTHNRVWGQIEADQSGKIQTPTSDLEIMRGKLGDLLYQTSRRIGKKVASEGGSEIEYVFGDHLASIEQDFDNGKVHVQFAKSGMARTFDLVVGADGLQSKTRRMVWGETSDQERVHKLNLYAGFFSMPVGQTDTMWRRWYHAPGRRGIMVRPDRINKKTTVLMMVLNDKDPRWADAATAAAGGTKSRDVNVKGQKKLLEDAFKGSGWESERIISQMNAADDFYYDMIAQVKMDRWSKGRVVLIGDAGFCASPISGMGTTLALNSAYSLAGLLSNHTAQENLNKALDQYEVKMRPLVHVAQKLAPGMPGLMHPETEWGVWFLNVFIGFMTWMRVISLFFRFKGPPAGTNEVEDFGFEQWSEY